MTHGEPQPSPESLMREHRLQRNLKIVVGGLGVLILLGLGAIIARVVSLASNSDYTPAPIASGTPGKTLSIEIPPGAKITSVSLSGNRLAIQHEGPGGTGIAILDLETGQRVADVKPVEQVPRN